jgi:tetratricopeptide (TPR) repeat protein
LSGVALTLALLLAPPAARAVITYDLLQDTPHTRELLKEEIGGSAVGAPDVAASPAAPAAGGGGDLETVWFAREKYLQMGEAERAQQQLQLLWEMALSRGVRNLPEYGAVLVREAGRRMATRDWEPAAQALGWARRLAPDELPVYTTGALLALRRNPLNVGGAWAELASGARAVGRSFRLQAWLRANLVGSALAGLSLFFALAIAFCCVPAAPVFVHDVRESIGFGSPRARNVLAWGALASPALVGFSPWWWVIAAALLLWPYLKLPARGLVAAGAVFALAMPLAARERASLLILSERPLLAAIDQVLEGNWTAADVAVLKAEAERGTAGVAGVTALGLAQRRLGRLDDAEAAFRAGLQAAPSDPALWNGIGTVAFARQDVDGAIAAFGKAVAANGRLFAPHYNLGVAYREKFKFAEGEAETRLAGEADPEAAAFYAGLGATRLKGLMVDALPRTSELWVIAHARSPEQEEATEQIWQSQMLGVPMGAWPVVLVALLALGGGLGAWRLKNGAAAACVRCGREFCPRCQMGRRGELCSPCHHIFVKKEGVDARVRVQKMGEIKAWRHRERLRHLACAALAPGGGHLAAGKFRTGVLLLLPAAFLASRVVLGAGVYASPWSLGGPASAWLTGAGGVALAALWALSFWLTYHFEE